MHDYTRNNDLLLQGEGGAALKPEQKNGMQFAIE